jgi:hypothetical protein
MVDIVALVLTVICAFAIVGVMIFIYKQIDETKAFVRGELRKIVAAVNVAQLNEFKHDKLTEQNIKTIDAKVDKIKKMLKELEDESEKKKKAWRKRRD